jgi:hypothetical protein
VMALSVVKRMLLRRFSRYSFCAECRRQPGDPPTRLNRLVKVLAALAFFAGFTLIGTPLAVILYLIGGLALRTGVKRFAAAPRAASLRPLLEAYGVFVTSMGALGALLAVLAGVVVYSEFL